jgi:hypothetical protein
MMMVVGVLRSLLLIWLIVLIGNLFDGWYLPTFRLQQANSKTRFHNTRIIIASSSKKLPLSRLFLFLVGS